MKTIHVPAIKPRQLKYGIAEEKSNEYEKTEMREQEIQKSVTVIQ